MGKKTSNTVSMGTRSKSNKEVKTTEGSKEEGTKGTPSRQSNRKASSLMKRMTALPPKGITPIWIQYYEAEAKDPDSDYGKGFRKQPDHFERLMETYVSSEDNFFDVLHQHPEACAVVFPDRSGAMKIIHHLTAENHGKPIIVGLEGFGSMSEVKAVHEELLVERVSVGDKEGRLAVPDLSDFISSPINDIDTSKKVEPGDGATDYVALAQVLRSQPAGYLIHPTWLPFIGRWKSLAFMAYIRPQVIEWSITLASTMIEFNHFLDLSPTHLPSHSSATCLHHHHGRPIKIEKFNVDFDG